MSIRHRFGGPWTVEKLRILSDYLNFYTQALKKTGFRTLYIDAFAGSGHCYVKIDGTEMKVPGSARIALEVTPPFHEYHFLEANPTRLRQLNELAEKYPDRNVLLIQNDANLYLPQLLAGSWRDRRAVLFLDPYGLEINWPTVEVIGNTHAIDVLFLVSLSGVYRQASMRTTALDEHKISALNRFLGTAEWRTAFYRREPMDDLFDGPQESRHASWKDIAEFIRERLSTVFLGGVNEPAILYLDSTPLYALYFSVANPSKNAQALARRVAKQIMQAH